MNLSVRQLEEILGKITDKDLKISVHSDGEYVGHLSNLYVRQSFIGMYPTINVILEVGE